MKPHWPRLALPFHTQATGWLDDHVMALRTGSVNAYLYRRDEALIAIDAGQNLSQLQQALAEQYLDGAQVQAVLLTHGDTDHVGGLEAFPQAMVYLGVGEEPLVTGQQRRFVFSYEPRLSRAHAFLAQDEQLTIAGVDVQTITTPGHTPGSTCYLIDGRYLFTGDTLSLRGNALAPFVRLINMNHAEQLRSICRLAQLRDVALLCTGHSGVSRAWEHIAQPWRKAAG